MPYEKIKSKNVDLLLESILKLETLEDAYKFFDDIMTVNEIASFAQRFQVAQMLTKGYTYQHIEQDTGASTATISRVKRSLNYGNDGLKRALEGLDRSCE
ncbi:MAG: YerC/YecD family TrpR-related protein [Vulcanibacillus sp.]